MATLSLQVHHYEKAPGSQQSRLVRQTPYVRITRDGHPPIYLQGGRVFGEGGPEIETLPAWFGEEVARLSPKVREEVGWRPVVVDGTKPAESQANSLEETPKTVKSSTWTCLECQEPVEMKRKGIHIAAHRRAATVG